MSEPDHPSLSRRAWARLALFGAVGLSFLPGCRRPRILGGPTCYAPPPPRPEGGGMIGTSSLARWAELGRVWRELGRLNTNPGEHVDERRAEFDSVKRDMEHALDALPAWPELRIVFEERVKHIDLLHYSQITCYAPSPASTPQPRAVVEEQVAALGKLVEEGKLTKEAAAKAAGVLAKQAEYYVQAQRLQDEAGGAYPHDALEALGQQYNEGALKPSQAATRAGKCLVEFTVDDLGLLADEPTEEELPKPESPGETKGSAP